MRAKVYIGAKKYAVYIGKKIIEKTLEFLTLPSKFISNKTQFLKNLTIFGHSVQNGTPTPDTPIEVESVGDRTKNLFDEQGIGYFSGSRTVYGNISYSNGKLIYNFTPSTNGGKNSIGSNSFYLEAGTYTVSYPDLKELNIYLVKENTFGSHDGGTNILTTSGTFTIQEKTPFHFGLSVLSGKDYDEIFNIQIEKSSTPTSYEPYGYKVPVTVSGKNLFDKDNFIQTNLYQSNAETAGIIRVLSNASTLLGFIFDVRKINGDITISRSVNGGAFRIFGTTDYPEAGVMATSLAIANGELTATCDVTNYNYITVICVTGSSSALTTVLQELQIELGDTATEYQPYSSITTDIYLNEPLRNLGNYIDTMSIVGKNINITRNINRIKISDLTWRERTDIGTGFFTSILNDRSFESDSVSLIECYTYASTVGSALDGYTKNDKSMTFYYRLDSPSRNIYIKDTSITTVDELLKKVENYYLYYQLLLPKIETYTIDTPIQLEQGNLTININTNVQPTKTMITGDIDNDN